MPSSALSEHAGRLAGYLSPRERAGCSRIAAMKQLWLLSKCARSLLGTRKRLDRSASSCSSSSSSSCSSRMDEYESSSSIWQVGDEELIEEGVPKKGCFAVYVDGQRFVVGTHLLSNPVFQLLLDRAADEYGYEQAGGLTIPCEAVLFHHILWLLDNKDPVAAMLEVKELVAGPACR